MKRMIDYKEFKELQQLANNNEQRLDYIEGAYTYFNLGLDDTNFDHLLPSAPEDLSPQTLEIGDTVYIEGESATLDADMIKEIFDSNLVILDCGVGPTSYPTVFLQRQYVDEDNAALSPRNARFKAFVTYGVALFEYTMTVAEYDATAQAGGYIVISCKEASTKPIYCHPIAMDIGGDTNGVLTCLIFNDSSTPYTKETFLDFIDAMFTQQGIARVLTSGGYKAGSDYIIGSFIGRNSSGYILYGFKTTGGTVANTYTTRNAISSTITGFNDGVNRIN